MNEKFDKYDLEVANKLGGLSTLIVNLDKKMDEYCLINNNQHDMMWKKLHRHSGILHAVMAIGSLISLLFLASISFVKGKIGY